MIKEEKVANKMTSFAERYREEGMRKGMQQGEVAVLLRQMERKFGHRLTEDDRRRMGRCNALRLLHPTDL